MIKACMKAPSESAKIESLQFPLYASPKVDGFRAIHNGTQLLSKTMKPFRNRHTDDQFNAALIGAINAGIMADLDGELVVGLPCGPGVIKRTSSGVTSAAGEPKVTLWVFDWFGASEAPFSARHHTAELKVKLFKSPLVKLLPQTLIKTPSELLELESQYLAQGYEGLMLRHPNGPYKPGRCTLNEGWLLKFKRFIDGEAVIYGIEEGQTNGNEATVREDGIKRRSTKKEGMVGNRQVGTLLCSDVLTGKAIKVSPGRMTKVEREIYLAQFGTGLKQDIKNKVVTYRQFPTDDFAAPRFPTFQCFRDLTIS